MVSTSLLASARRPCQLESVLCWHVSIRRTLCPAWVAASARPMASVLLPEPPLWVASTIVCIESPLDSLVGVCGTPHAWVHRIYAVPGNSCPGRARPDPGDRGSPNQYSIMMSAYGLWLFRITTDG